MVIELKHKIKQNILYKKYLVFFMSFAGFYIQVNECNRLAATKDCVQLSVQYWAVLFAEIG